MPPGAGAICLHPVELAFVGVSFRVALPVATLQQRTVAWLNDYLKDRVERKKG